MTCIVLTICVKLYYTVQYVKCYIFIFSTYISSYIVSFRMLLHMEQHNSCSTYTSQYIALCSMNLHTQKIFFDLHTHLSISRHTVCPYIHKKYFLIYIHISVYRAMQYERTYTKLFFYLELAYTQPPALRGATAVLPYIWFC